MSYSCSVHACLKPILSQYHPSGSRWVYQTGKQMLPVLLQDKEDPFLQAIQEPDDASHKGVIIMISFAEVKEAIRLRAEEDRKDRFRSLNQTQGVEAKMNVRG
ncbi:hypothetical protein CDAR_180531 [Caerostris darwini]|uniref:Uncharacterized protein n=1 Tax=Caerostris darwini TaxID=1538125 RepID=A0AAV4SVT5_9ARAC|nr:hypothetical protein CDAR_180531 [Caerostris darwini]